MHYPPVVCKDGFTVSVQAGSSFYCTPRVNKARAYTHVELGFPSEPLPERFDPYKELGGVYAYVPVEMLCVLIGQHGGIVSGELPPLQT